MTTLIYLLIIFNICRCFQLLQDCHLLAPPGIMNEEIVPRYDAILRTLSSWVGKPEVIINLFQLLSMLADRDVVKQRSVKVEEHELIYFVNKAIALHNSSKPVQRAALQLFEAIIENSDKKSFAAISTRIFKPVLDNLLLNGDDTSICFSSFSILNSLAGHAASLIAPWTDQIINLSLTTISKQLSGEVASQCLQLLGQITKDKDSLLTVAGHERGLKVFIDALTTLRPKNLSAMRVNLQILLSIIEDYDIATIAFQSIGDEDPLDYAMKLQGELKAGFDKFTRLCAEEDNLDERQMEDVFILHSQIDMTLEEMIKDVPEDMGENEEGQEGGEYDGDVGVTEENMVEAPLSQAGANTHPVDQRVPFASSVMKEEIPAAALLAEVEEEDEDVDRQDDDKEGIIPVDEKFAAHVSEVQFASTTAPTSALSGVGIVLPDEYEGDCFVAVEADSYDDHMTCSKKLNSLSSLSTSKEQIISKAKGAAVQSLADDQIDEVHEEEDEPTYQEAYKPYYDHRPTSSYNATSAESSMPSILPSHAQVPQIEKGNVKYETEDATTPEASLVQHSTSIQLNNPALESVPPPKEVQAIGNTFASVSPSYPPAETTIASAINPTHHVENNAVNSNMARISASLPPAPVLQKLQTYITAPQQASKQAVTKPTSTTAQVVSSPLTTHTFEHDKRSNARVVDTISEQEPKSVKSPVEPVSEHIIVSSSSPSGNPQRRPVASPQTLPLSSPTSPHPSQPPSRDTSRGRIITPNASRGRGKSTEVVERQPSPDKREKKMRREAELAKARIDKETIATQKKTIAEQNNVLEELVALLHTKDDDLLRMKADRKNLEDSAKASEGRATAAVMKVDQMKEALQIANEQSARAIEKANVTHNMFRDAVRKIEVLVMENEKVWNKFYELQSVEAEQDGMVSPIEPEQQGDMETETDMLSVQQSFNLESKVDARNNTPTPPSSIVPMHISTAKSVESFDNNDSESRSPTTSNVTPLGASLKRSTSFKLSSPAPMSNRKLPFRSNNASEFMLSPEGRSMQQASRNAVEDSKLSVSIAGILEALEHVDNSRYLSVDVTHSLYSDVQSTAEKVLMLFNRLSQAARRPVSSQAAGNPLLGSTLPIRSLRTCLENMGLMHNPADPSFSNCPDSRQRTELLLSQFRAKHITLFGAAFTLVLCASEKNSLNASMSSSRRVDSGNNVSQDNYSASLITDSLVAMRDVLSKVQLAIDRYLLHLENIVNADDALNPLDVEPLLLPGEFEDIVRLLEREKKPLAALFNAYTPWIDSSSKSNPTANNPVVAINSPDCRSVRRVSMSVHHLDKFASMVSGVGNRMRLQDAFCFAKDFTVCPGLFSSSQFTDVFNSVERPKPNNMNITMVDQNSMGRTLNFPQVGAYICNQYYLPGAQ
ncbi:hypothetical protein EON65_13690 [archaeon]|nr:MAG: hypothetical protein EON65_13690 [archaeon]